MKWNEFKSNKKLHVLLLSGVLLMICISYRMCSGIGSNGMSTMVQKNMKTVVTSLPYAMPLWDSLETKVAQRDLGDLKRLSQAMDSCSGHLSDRFPPPCPLPPDTENDSCINQLSIP